LLALNGLRCIDRRAGIAKRVGPHTLRHAFITAAVDAGLPLREVREAASHADPRTTMRDGPPVLDRHATYIRRHLHCRRLALTEPAVRRSVPLSPAPNAGRRRKCNSRSHDTDPGRRGVTAERTGIRRP